MLPYRNRMVMVPEALRDFVVLTLVCRKDGRSCERMVANGAITMEQKIQCTQIQELFIIPTNVIGNSKANKCVCILDCSQKQPLDIINNNEFRMLEMLNLICV